MDERAELIAWFLSKIIPLEAPLRSYLRKIVPADIDVDDLLHDVLIRVYMSDHWREIASPIAFCKAVARNLVYDHLRRRQTVQICLYREAELRDFIDDTPNAESTVIWRDHFRRLVEIASSLSPQCGKVFVLHRIYGFSCQEIAEQLSITASTVQKHLAKALRLGLGDFSREERDVVPARPVDRLAYARMLSE